MIEANIIYRGNKYYYINNNESHELVTTELTSKLIPNDIIKINDDKPITLIKRNSIYTIAIVRGFNLGNCYFYCPLLGHLYNPYLLVPKASIGDRFIVYITQIEFKIIKAYGSIYDRSDDWQIINDLYNLTNPLTLPITMKGEPLYTKPYTDLCDLPTFTIDPLESNDFDDAISCVGNKVYIHIVDIVNYLDKEKEENAARLAFTLYLAEGNHNILPKEIAESEWSLTVGNERRVITVEIIFNEDLTVNKYDIYQSTIIVKHRYNYENASINPFLLSISDKFKKNHLTIPTIKMIIEPVTGNLLNIEHEYNNSNSHRIIETLMVLTNMLISKHLNVHNLIPQRYHSKLKELSDVPPTKDEVINSFIAIKTFSSASYETDKTGHYGLGLNTYTHFTSPIRRYFDVIIHKILSGSIYEKTDIDNLLVYI